MITYRVTRSYFALKRANPAEQPRELSDHISMSAPGSAQPREAEVVSGIASVLGANATRRKALPHRDQRRRRLRHGALPGFRQASLAPTSRRRHRYVGGICRRLSVIVAVVADQPRRRERGINSSTGRQPRCGDEHLHALHRLPRIRPGAEAWRAPRNMLQSLGEHIRWATACFSERR